MRDGWELSATGNNLTNEEETRCSPLCEEFQTPKLQTDFCLGLVNRGIGDKPFHLPREGRRQRGVDHGDRAVALTHF